MHLRAMLAHGSRDDCLACSIALRLIDKQSSLRSTCLTTISRLHASHCLTPPEFILPAFCSVRLCQQNLECEQVGDEILDLGGVELARVAVLIHRVCIDPFDSVRALTATIASELGETARGSEHYKALFTLGILLFLVTFTINLLADILVRGRKGKKA